MKTYVELGLAALLAVLVYEKPKFLTNATNTTLGKVVMIVTVGLLAKLYGINAGILAAIIMIVLQDSNIEGFTKTEKGSWKPFTQKQLKTGIQMSFTGGKAVGETCSKDKDCGPCKKTCKKAKNSIGDPKNCACENSCKSGKCTASCACGECGDVCPPPPDKTLLHSQSGKEPFANIHNNLQPASFPITGTDQIGLSRMLKINAISATVAASQQANGCTNNGGGIAY